jgi:RHS repeat-associated protein
VAKSGTDLSLKRYRFTNKERDDETGLYYFGVRYYAAWLGRWTSSDPPPDCPDCPIDPSGNAFDLNGGEVIRRYGEDQTTVRLKGGATGHVASNSVAGIRTAGGVYMNAYFYADTGEFSGYHAKKGVTPIDNIPLINSTQLSLTGTAPSIDYQIGLVLKYMNFVDNHLDEFQMGLGALGMIPLLGEPADFADGVISALRGDWKGAALSFAAMIPVFGNAASAGKFGTRAQDLSKKFEKFHEQAADIIGTKIDEAFEWGKGMWDKLSPSPSVSVPGVGQVPLDQMDDGVSSKSKHGDGGGKKTKKKKVPSGPGKILNKELENIKKGNGDPRLELDGTQTK